MKNFRWVFLFSVIFILSSCHAKAQSVSPSEMAKAFTDAGVPLLGKAVALRDFSLPMFQEGKPAGTTQSPSALKGKVVFLNFWATWCGPCLAEMPSMEALYGKYRDKGLEILAVNCMENESDVLAFMKENNFSFPVLIDDGQAGSTYGVQMIPSTYIINREGQIVLRLIGSIDWNTPKIHTALELLLNS